METISSHKCAGRHEVFGFETKTDFMSSQELLAVQYIFTKRNILIVK